MAIRQILAQASEIDEELLKIEYNISLIITMAQTLIDNDFKEVQFIIENLPSNGAKPYIQPLYPPQAAPPAFMSDSIEPGKADPVGYARWYAVEELKKNPLIMIQIDLDASTTLAILDKAIIRLKQRKTELLDQSKQMLKINKSRTKSG